MVYVWCMYGGVPSLLIQVMGFLEATPLHSLVLDFPRPAKGLAAAPAPEEYICLLMSSTWQENSESTKVHDSCILGPA